MSMRHGKGDGALYEMPAQTEEVPKRSNEKQGARVRPGISGMALFPKPRGRHGGL